MTQLKFIEALRRRKHITTTTYEILRELIDELDIQEWFKQMIYNIDLDKKDARNAARRAARSAALQEKMKAYLQGK